MLEVSFCFDIWSLMLVPGTELLFNPLQFPVRGNLHTNPYTMWLGSFWVGQHIHMLRVMHPKSTGTEAPASGPSWTSPYVPPRLTLICVLDHVPYDKRVNTSKCFPEFCDHSSKLSSLRGNCGNPQLCSQVGQKCADAGDPLLAMCLKCRQSCGTELLTRGGWC